MSVQKARTEERKVQYPTKCKSGSCGAEINGRKRREADATVRYGQRGHCGRNSLKVGPVHHPIPQIPVNEKQICQHLAQELQLENDAYSVLTFIVMSALGRTNRRLFPNWRFLRLILEKKRRSYAEKRTESTECCSTRPRTRAALCFHRKIC